MRRRIQKMVEGFYGRMTAYRDGLAGGEGALEAALRRNLYRNTTPNDDAVVRLADYVRAQTAALAALDDAGILTGQAGFTPPDWGAEDNTR